MWNRILGILGDPRQGQLVGTIALADPDIEIRGVGGAVIQPLR